ncbi:MAG: hypothetical protein K1X74_08065 [Pirellulales bacterium]|nr:hypothetical protein [Pirellulales bacterium]
MTDHATLLATVLQHVRELAGCDPQAVRPDTHFFADLGLGSIDAVVLGERLESQIGRPLRFAEGLAELARLGRDDITLAEIAALVALQIASAQEDG